MNPNMKHFRLTRITAVVLSVCMLCSALWILTPTADAAVKITQTVNLSHPEKNMRGNGYYWANRTDTLTLTDLYIDTTDEYGMKITAGATVILKGDNYIKASGVALGCAGDVIFKGDGSLTLVSDDIGLYFYATKDSATARFLSGTYEITAGGHGIYSPHSSVSFVDGKWTITAPNAEANAIEGRAFKLYGGKMTMDNAIHATVSLDIQALSLSVTAGKPALVSDKTMKIEDVALSVGAAADALTASEEYNGENCISMRSTKKNLGSSILFGEDVPQIVDILLLLVLLALITAGIAVPFIRSRQKAKRAREALAAAEAEAEAARRAEKAARKNRN